MVLNTCSRNKRQKNCEESRWRSQSALVRPLAMLYLINAKISLVPKHQLIVPSALLALPTYIRTCKATKMHTLTPLTYELFFQNSSKSEATVFSQLKSEEKGTKTNLEMLLILLNSRVQK